MHSQIARVDSVTPADLDAYLANGWYRVGQVMMTCRMLVNDTGLRSTVWTRTPLDGYRFKRSHRKLLNRTDRDFRLEEGPAVLDDEHEALYQRYLTTVSGERSESLQEFLLGDGIQDRFEPRELSIWEDDRLVAFSWYDVGVESMQSLIGVYDPAYKRRSLGFITVLLEVREAVERGLAYHYTGYVLPGDPSMDYKLRVRPIEFLDPHTSEWRPYDELDPRRLPAERLQARMREAQNALSEHGVGGELLHYSPFRLHGPKPPLQHLLGEPLVLDLGEVAPHIHWMAGFDLDERVYKVLKCHRGMARLGGSQPEQVQVWIVVEEAARPEALGDLVFSVLRRVK